MKLKKTKKDENFLEYVVVKNDEKQWEETNDGLIRFIIPRDGLLDKIVRLLFNTPEEMKIDLDEIGTEVWKQIDNERNVKEIADRVEDEFGEKIEPLYPRLVKYIKILKNNEFIQLKKETVNNA
jgi:hypothetical protein